MKTDFEDLAKTLLSLILLVFVLTAIRKAVIFLAGRYNFTAIVSFLS